MNTDRNEAYFMLLYNNGGDLDVYFYSYEQERIVGKLVFYENNVFLDLGSREATHF